MFFNLKTVNGDLFTAECSLAHCVGADFRMGMGIAVKFRDLFGKVQFLKNQNVKVGGCAVLKDGNRFIYYLVTKEKTGGGCLPTYQTLESSLKSMREHMLNNNVKEVAIPTIGCGLDRLEWSRVESMIFKIFGNDPLQITVYKFLPQPSTEVK